jgi:hypothetical protein
MSASFPAGIGTLFFTVRDAETIRLPAHLEISPHFGIERDPASGPDRIDSDQQRLRESRQPLHQ